MIGRIDGHSNERETMNVPIQHWWSAFNFI